MKTSLTKEGLWQLSSPSLSSLWVWLPHLHAAFSGIVYWNNNPHLDTEKNCEKWRTVSVSYSTQCLPLYGTVSLCGRPPGEPSSGTLSTVKGSLGLAVYIVTQSEDAHLVLSPRHHPLSGCLGYISRRTPDNFSYIPLQSSLVWSFECS